MTTLVPFFAQPLPAWKRAMDVVGALSGLIILSPLFVLIAILIKMVSRGPIFFKQERVGYLGKKFMLWKFRTMHVDSEPSVHIQYINKIIKEQKYLKKLDFIRDDRIFRFGKTLRVLCLDEIPQLINVLYGDTSLVGPRPEVTYAIQHYKSYHMKRFIAVPGMTGLWQISRKDKKTFNEMINLDILYTKEMSFFLDLKIIFLTIPSIIYQFIYFMSINMKNIIFKF